jgi:hypothetical protein
LHSISTLTASTETPLEIVQGSVTGTVAFPAFQIETTWNNAGLTGQGIVESVTNTASAAGSKLINLLVGGTSQFTVDKAGNVVAVTSYTAGTDNSVAGTLQIANAAANAHTIWASAATTSNTIAGFAAVPVTGHIVTCTVAATTCTLTDGGVPGGASSGTNLVQVSNGTGGFISNAAIQEDTVNGYIGNVSTSLTAPLDIEKTVAIPTSGSNYQMAKFFLTTTNTNGASAIGVHAVDEVHTFTGQGNAGTQSGHYISCTDQTTGAVTHDLCSVARLSSNPATGATYTIGAASYTTADFNGAGTTSRLVGYFEDGGVISGTGTVSEWNGFTVAPPSTSAGVSLNNTVGLRLNDFSGVNHQSGSGCLVNLLFGGGCGGKTDAWTILDFTSNNSALHALSVGSTSTPGGGAALDVTGGSRSSTFVNAATYVTATNCSSSASPAVCGSAAAGSVVIAAAGTTVTVNTTAVTANSQIFLLADDTLGTKLGVTCNSTLATLVGGLAVTARTGGTSFQITSGTTPAVNPLCLSYFIVN